MATVEAALVEAGVGLPFMWAGHWPGRTDQGGFYVAGTPAGDAALREGRVVALADQTRSGCLRRLALWAGNDGEAQAYYIVEHSGGGYLLCCESGDSIGFATLTAGSDTILPWAPTSGLHPTEALAAILTHIGLDHRIRRALGEDPKPGTLADIGLMQPHEEWWRYDARGHGGAFIEWDRDGRFIGSSGIPGGAPNVPALADITDPTEAHTAIDEALSA